MQQKKGPLCCEREAPEGNPEDFSASLVMSDGPPSGAVLRLRSMFEVFAAQIAEDDG